MRVNDSSVGGSITLGSLQRAMTFGAGVLRDAGSLTGVLDVLPLSLPAETPAQYELNNLVTVARTLVAAALRREESRGTHTRLDFTEQSTALLGRFIHLNGYETSFVPLVIHSQPPADVLLTDSKRLSTEVV